MIPILMYHSISEVPQGEVMRSLHVTPGAFARQMWLLNLLGFKALSMRDLKPYLDGEKSGKVVGLTFDDGYKNTLHTALPIFQKYDFSATCYFVTGHIGGYNQWDEAKGIAKNLLMDQKELLAWHQSGNEVGAHTHTHLNFLDAADTQIRDELVLCQQSLASIIGQSIDTFCYPYGGWREPQDQWVREAGFKNATTMRRGRALLGSDSFRLPRVPVNNRTSLVAFAQKILTKYEDRK